MNDLDHRLEVVSRSRQPLHCILRWISRKPLQVEAWFQKTTNRKWHMDYQMVTWPMTSGNVRHVTPKVLWYSAVLRSDILASDSFASCLFTFTSEQTMFVHLLQNFFVFLYSFTSSIITEYLSRSPQLDTGVCRFPQSCGIPDQKMLVLRQTIANLVNR